jgi:hypothetical protein
MQDSSNDANQQYRAADSPILDATDLPAFEIVKTLGASREALREIVGSGSPRDSFEPSEVNPSTAIQAKASIGESTHGD